MQGLSAWSVIFNFFSELIIALYLYDSEETSFLILFEIFLGVGKCPSIELKNDDDLDQLIQLCIHASDLLAYSAISAWKVTKAINIFFTRESGQLLPRISLRDKKDYKESDTKKYDETAIKFMSIALLPCCIGYSIYSLKTKKYKSWYSFVVSSLAGTVYTFGKLRSLHVDVFVSQSIVQV